ncbi:peptidoglycan-binding protein [Streptomyces sp. CA-210063]|uniref:peptidoglycan-binding domain-containing protein n=1 Tax=Streptomyces sp. CA-210063 TaxID=2801029 RepID=UPI00214CB400|nr:peptidoglycan-binding protein [Streptomyces sp. CA-210063]UUU31845.1 peptidoglycan-binding protein [Streptomyces sp. CA-210063]
MFTATQKSKRRHLVSTALLATALAAGVTATAPAATAEPVSQSARVVAQASWPVVKSGQRGVDVETVQLLLTARGYATGADGIFGSGTAAKVKQFQKSRGLAADGVVGPNTWSKLVMTVKQGAKGPAVKAAQRQLSDNGFAVSADGAFGPATAEKVRAFQKAKGLAADGVVGPNTWARLVNGGGGGGGNPGGGKLSDAQAAARLKAAGITRTSSGNCTDRNRKNCTSLQDIRVGTIDGVIALKKNSGCKVVITGGTEVGHAGGTYSHWNGYKVDVSRTACVTTYIQKHSKKHHKRGDGAWVWRVTSGGKTVIDYADENWANHWDITYY